MNIHGYKTSLPSGRRDRFPTQSGVLNKTDTLFILFLRGKTPGSFF